MNTYESDLFTKSHYLDSSTSTKTTAVKEDPSDVLDKAKCLTALAELRHAKWFQVGREHVLTFKYVITSSGGESYKSAKTYIRNIDKIEVVHKPDSTEHVT